MSDYGAYSRLSSAHLAALLGPGNIDDKSVQAFDGKGALYAVDSSSLKSLTTDAVELLRDGALKGDPDSIELLVNLAVKQDEVGRNAENVLFEIFSREQDAAAPEISPEISDEVARQSLRLYELATPTLTVSPRSKGNAAADIPLAGESKVAHPSPSDSTPLGTSAPAASAASYSSSMEAESKSDSATPLAFSKPSKLAYMAGAGAEMAASEARNTLATAKREAKGAAAELRKAERVRRSSSQAPGRQLVDAEQVAEQARSRFLSAEQASNSAQQRKDGAEQRRNSISEILQQGSLLIKDVLSSNKAGRPGNPWDRSRFLWSTEVDAGIMAATTSIRQPAVSVLGARDMKSLNAPEIRDLLKEGKAPIFVPLDAGDHWVSLVVHKDGADKTKAVFFSSAKGYYDGRARASGELDPDGKDIIEWVRGVGADLAQALGLEKDKIAVIELDMQRHAPNGCGVFTVEAFKRVSANPTNPGKALTDFKDEFARKRQDEQARFNTDGRRQMFGALIDAAAGADNGL